MTKRILSIALALFMVLSIAPLTVFAVETHSHAMCADCSTTDGEQLEFTPYDGTTDYTSDANVYLTEDLVFDSTYCISVSEGATLNLCLNGYSIIQNDANYYVAFVLSGATLNICDCTSGSDNGIRCNGNGAVTNYGSTSLYGIDIKGTSSAVYCTADSTTTLDSCRIHDCADSAIKTTNDSPKTINVKNCEIFNNEAYSGAGIYTQSNVTLNVTNTKLYNNKASASGGAIYSKKSFVTLDGCEIYGNSAVDFGGSAYFSECVPTFIDTKIYGNSSSDYGLFIDDEAVLAGGVIVISDNVKNGTYNEEKGIYEGSEALNLRFNDQMGALTVCEELGVGSKICLDLNTHKNEYVAAPDGASLTTLEGMEKYFFTDAQDKIMTCDDNGNIVAIKLVTHAPTADEPYVEIDERFVDSATFEWYEDGELIADATGSSITPEANKSYKVIVSIGDSEIEYSFSTVPYVDRQPSLLKPTFEVYPNNLVETYKWYETALTEKLFTNENASNVCSTCETDVTSTYDPATGLWTGAKRCDAGDGHELFYFEIELKEGDVVYFDCPPEITELMLFDPDRTSGHTPSYSMVGNVMVFVSDNDATYIVSANTPSLDSKIKAFMIEQNEPSLVEGESENTLNNMTVGYLYRCVADFGNDVTLGSNSFRVIPTVISQPYAEYPTFVVTFANEAKYQWYAINDDESVTAVEGETTDTLSALEYGKSYYCEASFPFGMNVESDVISTIPDIIKHPTVTRPTFEVTFEDSAKFQWYESPFVYTSLNDSDVYDSAASYDEDTERWTGYVANSFESADATIYEVEWFEVYLSKGEVLKITLDDASVISTDDKFYFNLFYEAYTESVAPGADGKTYVFEAPESDYYYLYSYTIDEAVTAKFEVSEYDFEPIEGETDKTLSNIKYNYLYVCAATYPDDTILESDLLRAKGEIIKQPTAKDPTIEVTFEDKAEYQWYESEPEFVTIDDTYVDYIDASYDEETGYWTASDDEGNDYYGITEYSAGWFDIYLEKGDAVIVTFEDPSAISIDSEFRFYSYEEGYSIYVRPAYEGTYIFEAPESSSYELYSYALTPEISARFEFVSFENTALDGETEKTLSDSALTLGNYYVCVATYEDGAVLTSNTFVAAPVITKNPTSDNPSVEVYFENADIEYQWYFNAGNGEEITEENASSAHYSDSEGDPSYYDEENGYWVPSLYKTEEYGDAEHYEFDIFEIELKEGDVLTIIPSDEIKYRLIYSLATNSYVNDDCWTYNNGVYTFTAPSDDTYSFYVETFAKDITFKAYLGEFEEAVAIEGETEKTLGDFESGLYYCVITYGEGIKLVSAPAYLEKPYTLGDVNADGKIDQFDYILVKRHYFETRVLTEDEMLPADANCDGEVNQYDYILIRRHYFGTYVIGG